MNLYRKVRAVEKVFLELEKETERFVNKTGVACLEGCSRCCTKSDIYATVLEFLPFAYHAYKERRLVELYENLKLITSSGCPLHNPFHMLNGRISGCTQYVHRGLVCRLFGYSSNKDKSGMLNWITCRELKQTFPDVAGRLKSGEILSPLYTNYYLKLRAIDITLADEYLPIGEAILKAAEIVLFYYSFKGKRAA